MNRKPTQPSCHRCFIQEGVLLKYNITANGKNQYFWYCTRCECITPRGTFLRHDEVAQLNLSERFYIVALLNNYQINVYCAICGASGAEQHHFAPQSLREYFGDNWGKWPVINLCCQCHRLWHVTVTPWMCGYNSDPTAIEIMQKYGRITKNVNA